MKTIFKLSALVAAIACLFSCETYKVADPEMTAIHQIDGKYMSFAIDDSTTPVDTTTILAMVITNTTDNASDAAWITVSDMNYGNYYPTTNYTRLLGIRFRASVDMSNLTFKATDVEVEEPTTAWNPYIEGYYGSYGSYYTCQYQRGLSLGLASVSIDGKVITDGVTTPSGYKADYIEYTLTLNYASGTSAVYKTKGQKKTGWVEDAIEYEGWLANAGLW